MADVNSGLTLDAKMHQQPLSRTTRTGDPRNPTRQLGTRAAFVDALDVLRAVLPELRPGPARVAALIVTSPETALHLSAKRLAELAHTSDASVVRLSQKLGFGGYGGLKLALAGSLGWRLASGSDAAEGLAMGSHLLRDASEAVLRAASQVDPAVFDQIVRAIHHARRVLIAGSWAEREEFCQLFASVGVVAQGPMSVPSQLAAARILGARSVCIVVCQSGETAGSLEVARAAQEASASVVVLTSAPRSTVSRLGDTVLCIQSATNSVFRPLADHLALTALVYAIITAVARLRQVKGSSTNNLTARKE